MCPATFPTRGRDRVGKMPHLLGASIPHHLRPEGQFRWEGVTCLDEGGPCGCFQRRAQDLLP